MKNIPSISVLLITAMVPLAAHEGWQHASSSSNGGTSQVEITEQGDTRVITANGIPAHATGAFPNRNNPNAISVQNYQFRVSLNPQPAGRLTPLGMHPFGVGLNGVPFDPGAAEWWNNDRNAGWQYEPMSGVVNLGIDRNNAHVQPTGAYHYHAMPTGLVRNQDHGQGMIMVGYAADGFPIYADKAYDDPNDAGSTLRVMKPSYRVKSGTRPSGPGGRYDGSFVQDYEYVPGLGDLDEANGRTGVTPEYPDGTYYYVITQDFPFIPRYFVGTPDASFLRGGPGGQMARGHRGPGGHPPPGGHGHPPPGGHPPPR